MVVVKMVLPLVVRFDWAALPPTSPAGSFRASCRTCQSPLSNRNSLDITSPKNASAIRHRRSSTLLSLCSELKLWFLIYSLLYFLIVLLPHPRCNRRHWWTLPFKPAGRQPPTLSSAPGLERRTWRMLWPPIQPNSTFTPTLKLIFKTGPLATGMILNGVIYIQGCVPDICPGDCNH